MKRVAVLASGRGSNLGALIEAQARLGSYRISLVLANVEGAAALDLALRSGIEAACVPSRGVSRAEHEASVLARLHNHRPDLICLAGYMRVLGEAFIEAAGAPILNIHPSLLPSFPGVRAQMQAIAAGVRISGATVHFVDAGLDSGPILAQAAVPVSPHDTEQTLSARILEVEHRIYPETVDMVARGAYRIQGNRVIPA